MTSNITSIGKGAFQGCTSLETITLPFIGGSKDSNNYLGYIFGASSVDYNYKYVPSSLKEVIILEGCTSIGEYAFYNCSSLTSITIPSSVTTIEGSAFGSCNSLRSVIIPSSVTSIGEGAFSGCSSLQYNEYDNGLYLGNEENPYLVLVKAKDKSITSCKLNVNTKFIYNSAFYGCSSLTSITIPSSVTSIESSVFYNCSSLIFITIPSSVTSIGNNAFSGCGSLASIIIPSSVTTIGYRAFYGCTSLETITLPFIGESKDSNNYLGYIFGASSYEENSSYVPSSLKEVIILNGCSSIRGDAFYGCSSLTSILIPNSVITIGSNAFMCCDMLIIYCEKNSQPNTWSSTWNSSYRPVYYGVTKDNFIEKDGIQYLIIEGKAVITRYIGSDDNVIIPSLIEVNGTKYDVAEIGEYAFSNSSIKSIVISNSVSSIGEYAFSNCNSLIIYCEASNEPSGWNSDWNSSDRPVYWKNEWEYVNDKPTR